MRRILSLLVGLALTSGCTLIADLDSYSSVNDEGCALQMRLDNFTPHRADPVIFEAVNSDGDAIRAIAIIDPLLDPDRAFEMPGAVPRGLHYFQFWADVDGDGQVNTAPIGADHSWLLDDACNYASTCPDEEPNCFSHRTPFDTLNVTTPVGSDLDLTVSGLPTSAGLLEVHLVEVDTSAEVRRVVGLFRTDQLEDASSRDVLLPGLLIDDVTYAIDLLVDLDGNGTIDPATEVWALPELSGQEYADALTVDTSTFDPAGVLPAEGLLVTPLP